jgi:membrane protein DedA with SNARE-associated domain
MHEFIVSTVETLGYFGIAVLMALENIFPPMPSEAILGAGALAIKSGSMAFWPLLISGTIGTVIGNLAWFWVGKRTGYEALRPVIDRHGRWLTLEWQDVERLSVFFARHGHWAVLILRATPFMRTMISLPAGMAHMPTAKFLIFTTIGCAVWNALLIGATLWISNTFANIENVIAWVLIGVIGLAAIAYVWRLIVWKPRARR